MTFDETFKRLRRASVPLVAIETEDQPNTVMKIRSLVNGKTPVVQWDILRGMVGLNDEGVKVANSMNNGKPPAEATSVPTTMLRKVYDVPATIILMLNAHRFISNESIGQGIANLREQFKEKQSTLVLLCPAITLPSELKQDIMIISDPLPDIHEIGGMVTEMCTGNEVQGVDEDVKERISDTLIGLSAFSAEQTLASSIYLNDEKLAIVDREALWQKKCVAIKQTPGLSILDSKEDLASLKGCDNIIGFLKKLDTKYRCIVLIDEIDKGFAAVGSDTSGVSQDQLGAWLTWMQDGEVDGLIFSGVAGSGKSAIAKAIARHYGVIGLGYDMGAMKSKFVGESGAMTRQSLKVIDAVGQGRVLVIATCNNMTVLPPELRRRFTMGTFFFDSPGNKAREQLWQVYRKKYNVKDEATPPTDMGWTGAEICQCCKLASTMQISLEQASQYIVPVTVSAREQIEAMRSAASGKYISAAVPGVYQKDAVELTGKKIRKTSLREIES